MKVMPYKAAHAWEKQAAKRGVSKVARSSRGFMRAYEQAGSWSNLSDKWKNKRNNFVKRHMAQVRQNDEQLWENGKPSRRALALIMWAYMPPGRPNNAKPNPSREEFYQMGEHLKNVRAAQKDIYEKTGVWMEPDELAEFLSKAYADFQRQKFRLVGRNPTLRVMGEQSMSPAGYIVIKDGHFVGVPGLQYVERYRTLGKADRAYRKLRRLTLSGVMRMYQSGVIGVGR